MTPRPLGGPGMLDGYGCGYGAACGAAAAAVCRAAGSATRRRKTCWRPAQRQPCLLRVPLAPCVQCVPVQRRQSAVAGASSCGGMNGAVGGAVSGAVSGAVPWGSAAGCGRRRGRNGRGSGPRSHTRSLARGWPGCRSPHTRRRRRGCTGAVNTTWHPRAWRGTHSTLETDGTWQ